MTESLARIHKKINDQNHEPLISRHGHETKVFQFFLIVFARLACKLLPDRHGVLAAHLVDHVDSDEIVSVFKEEHVVVQYLVEQLNLHKPKYKCKRLKP